MRLGFTYRKTQDNFIMNQTYMDHKADEWEVSYAYSSIVGGLLHYK
jgi:hypothetical protein